MQKLLENFTIDRHKKVMKEKEINLEELLYITSSSTAPPANLNVSDLQTAQSMQFMKSYVDQEQGQLASDLAALRASDMLIKAQGISTIQTFPSHMKIVWNRLRLFHRRRTYLSRSSRYMVCL